MEDKWRQPWLDEVRGERVGNVHFRRAIGELPEMESSKAAAERLKTIAREGDRILDVGCSAGHYLNSLRRVLPLQFHYTGVDATPRYIELACQAFGHRLDTDFQVGDIYGLPFPDASYDLVMSNNLLLHLPSIQKPLHELCRVARRFVLVRTLVGERSFRIQDVHPSGDEDAFDENGEPLQFTYINIYSSTSIGHLLSRIPAVRSWRITPEQDFDKNRIMEDSREHDKAFGMTTILGDWQVNGYILQPWAFVEIEIAR